MPFSHIGMCIPDSCSEDDLRSKLAKDTILGIVESAAIGRWDPVLHVNMVKNCKSDADETELTPGDKGFMWINCRRMG